MADKEKLVKVVAIYDGLYGEKLDLWGVGFVKVDEYYEAEITKELAESMLKAGRVAIK